MRFCFMLLVLVLVGCGDCPDCVDCVDALDVPDAGPVDALDVPDAGPAGPADAHPELNLCHPMPVTFECDDGECIVGAYRCNGYRDCAGGEDEEGCPDAG